MRLHRLASLLSLALLASFTSFASAADVIAIDKRDAEFVRKASQCGLCEVRSSEAAIKRGVLSPEERAFAQKLIDDHDRMNKELAAIASRKNLTVASELDKDAKEKSDKLAGVADKDYAEEYLEHQISGHKDAIDLFEDQSEDSKDVELKEFAAKHLPHLRSHLETAKALEAKR